MTRAHFTLLRIWIFVAVFTGCTATTYRYEPIVRSCESMRCGETAFGVKDADSCAQFVEQERFNIQELAASRDAGVPATWDEESLCTTLKNVQVRVYEPEDLVLVRRGFRPTAQLINGVEQNGFRFPGDNPSPLWVNFGVTRWKGLCWTLPDGSCELAERHEIIVRDDRWWDVLCHEQFWHFAGRMPFEPPQGSPVEAACARARKRGQEHAAEQH